MTLSASTKNGRRLFGVFAFAVIGVAVHYGALAWVERLVSSYPAVSDPLLDRMPRVDFGWWGEGYYFLLIGAFLILFFGRLRHLLEQGFIAIGMFYFLRSLFLFFLPIGAPHGSVSPDERLNIWGYAEHAFFPGGHVGILFLLALLIDQPRIRAAMLTGAAIFGLGTMLAKTHYTADVLGGFLLAYAIYAGLRLRRFRPTT